MTTTVLTLADLKNLQTSSDAYKVKATQTQEYEQKQALRRELMNQLVTFIAKDAVKSLTEATTAGRGDTIIFQFRPVMRDPEDPEGKRKLYAPEDCYWTGLDVQGNRVNASTGGVPFSVLAFGSRVEGRDGRMYNDPSTLPGGNTLGKLLEKHYAGCKVVTRYNKEHQLGTVRLVWDLESWVAREARQQARRKLERAPREQREQREPREQRAPREPRAPRELRN
jgi:hypothetical protein